MFRQRRSSDELNAMGSTGKKNSSTLEENELNYLLEKFSKDNSVADLTEYLNSAKQPVQEKKAEKEGREEGRAAQGRKARSARKRRPNPLPRTITRSTARRRTSSTKSARRRPSP